jgi:SSS family solute:Na+ symporter
MQRGLGAGLSIYAPAIILSSVLGWPLYLTNLLIGCLVITYTVSRRHARGQSNADTADG